MKVYAATRWVSEDVLGEGNYRDRHEPSLVFASMEGAKAWAWEVARQDNHGEPVDMVWQPSGGGQICRYEFRFDEDDDCAVDAEIKVTEVTVL